MTASVRSVLSPAVLVVVATCAVLAGLVAVAGPASALTDLRRPHAEVTHGPSCGPGVVRVAVTNGSQPQRVALVFAGVGEQGSAELAAGEQVELVSADVDWGRTVDVSVTVTTADGTAGEPIEFGTYTRPTAQDCAAIAPPGSASSALAPAAAADPVTAQAAADVDRPEPAVAAPAASVSPGGVVTVRGTGFTPGEPVTVSMLGRGDALSTVTAAADGSVEVVVQIPRGTQPGAATVQLVGGRSTATAGMDLELTARARPASERAATVPGYAAGGALAVAAAFLGLLAARRGRGARSLRR